MRHLVAAAMAAALVCVWPAGADPAAQGRIAAAKSLRCSFARSAVGTWKMDGAPNAAVQPADLVLRFEAIDSDQGTAQLRTGSMSSDVIVRLAGGYLHFMQSFRTGPLYTTTVFDKDTKTGPLKAVHSRHEYFPVPLSGATSSPANKLRRCRRSSTTETNRPMPRVRR